MGQGSVLAELHPDALARKHIEVLRDFRLRRELGQLALIQALDFFDGGLGFFGDGFGDLGLALSGGRITEGISIPSGCVLIFFRRGLGAASRRPWPRNDQIDLGAMIRRSCAKSSASYSEVFHRFCGYLSGSRAGSRWSSRARKSILGVAESSAVGIARPGYGVRGAGV
ncbi:MAG TPA: hypothetical protein VF161_02340 [Steroidobacteraceae bacterium]